MPKKNTKSIIAALKKAGVDIEDQDKVEGLLDDLELLADETLGTDKMILTKEEHRELKDDLTKLRKRAKDAEGDLETLQKDVDAGDSTNARKLKLLQTRNDELEPLVKELVGAYTDTWNATAKEIPKELRTQFKFAEKEGGDLETSDLLHNIRKLEEYRAIGILEGGTAGGDGDGGGKGDGDGDGDGAGGGLRVKNKQKPGKLTEEQLANMSASEKIESGYVYDEKNRSHRDAAEAGK